MLIRITLTHHSDQVIVDMDMDGERNVSSASSRECLLRVQPPAGISPHILTLHTATDSTQSSHGRSTANSVTPEPAKRMPDLHPLPTINESGVGTSGDVFSFHLDFSSYPNPFNTVTQRVSPSVKRPSRRSVSSRPIITRFIMIFTP